MQCFLRSPLANTIHLSEVNDLVKQLVMVCRMAAATIAGTESLSIIVLYKIFKEPKICIDTSSR
jgi:hypothetical protein